jgi:hypothetical protein
VIAVGVPLLIMVAIHLFIPRRAEAGICAFVLELAAEAGIAMIANGFLLLLRPQTRPKTDERRSFRLRRFATTIPVTLVRTLRAKNMVDRGTFQAREREWIHRLHLQLRPTTQHDKSGRRIDVDVKQRIVSAAASMTSHLFDRVVRVDFVVRPALKTSQRRDVIGCTASTVGFSKVFCWLVAL